MPNKLHTSSSSFHSYAANLRGKEKWPRYRPGVAQRMGRGIALLFHDRSTRRRWVVSSTPRPLFTPGKDPVPILQEAGWAPGPLWSGGKSRPHRDSIPDRQARSQSLYRLSYPAHKLGGTRVKSCPRDQDIRSKNVRLTTDQREYSAERNESSSLIKMGHFTVT